MNRSRVLGILISGRGSNLQAILDAIRDGRLDASVGVVISNRAGAPGLQHASRSGVPTRVVSHKDYDSRDSFDAELVEVLRAHGVELVCLAGFMRILSPVLVRAFPRRILNIHPSLLPAFVGLHAQRQAWEYGAKLSGVTVHLVDEELDHGPILLQEVVPILADDTEESLASRILEKEHAIYPKAIQLMLENRVKIEGRRAVIQT